jgi:DNA-directed RNA polymerase subunit RPC12/RpoP
VYTKLRALNAAVDKWWEFGSLDAPLCPHCKSEFDISENEAWHLYDDQNSHEVECPTCEMNFRVETHASYTFSTDDQNE